MDKNEFLEKLAKALAGQVPASVIEENINYYSSYISGEVQKGHSLQQVLEELGDPRLIAKSIIDANGGGSDMAGYYEDSDSGRIGGYRGEQEAEKQDPFGQPERNFRSFHFSGFWGLFLLIVIVCCIFMVVGTMIGGIILLIRPILLPLIIILLVYHMFQGPRRF